MNIKQKNLIAKIVEDVTILKPGKDFIEFPILFNNNKFIPGDVIATKINDYAKQLIIVELPYEYEGNYVNTVKYLTRNPEEYIDNIYLQKDIVYELIGSTYSQAQNN